VFPAAIGPASIRQWQIGRPAAGRTARPSGQTEEDPEMTVELRPRMPDAAGAHAPDGPPAAPRDAALRVDAARQRAVPESLDRLVGEFDERQARLVRQLAAAVQLLADSRVGGPVPGAPPAAGPAVPPGVGAAPPAGRAAVYCLGAFTLLVGGEPVGGWRASRARGLFQYLVCHRGRPVPRDELVAAIWPDAGAGAAGTSLRVAAHALRRILGRAPAGGDGGAPLTVLARGAGYALGGAEPWLDVDAFERCAALGRRLEGAGRRAGALALYARAADLYRGDFLPDSWEEWVTFRREALKDQFLFVLGRVAELALAAGDPHACIAHCQRVLAHDRCREDVYRLLMACYGRLGQRGRVRRWYELCVRALRAELDVAPEPDTEDCYLRALRGAG
jgi:DNA-binding SARP family transcriptional activator